jgi:hypothetical protein
VCVCVCVWLCVPVFFFGKHISFRKSEAEPQSPPLRGTADPKLASKLRLARTDRGGSGESRAPEIPCQVDVAYGAAHYCHIPTSNIDLLVLPDILLLQTLPEPTPTPTPPIR